MTSALGNDPEVQGFSPPQGLCDKREWGDESEGIILSTLETCPVGLCSGHRRDDFPLRLIPL
jgi:hypothetical protein